MGGGEERPLQCSMLMQDRVVACLRMACYLKPLHA